MCVCIYICIYIYIYIYVLFESVQVDNTSIIIDVLPYACIQFQNYLCKAHLVISACSLYFYTECGLFIGHTMNAGGMFV